MFTEEAHGTVVAGPVPQGISSVPCPTTEEQQGPSMVLHESESSHVQAAR